MEAIGIFRVRVYSDGDYIQVTIDNGHEIIFDIKSTQAEFNEHYIETNLTTALDNLISLAKPERI